MKRKITLYLDNDLIKQLKFKAIETNKSVSGIITNLAEAHLNGSSSV